MLVLEGDRRCGRPGVFGRLELGDVSKREMGMGMGNGNRMGWNYRKECVFIHVKINERCLFFYHNWFFTSAHIFVIVECTTGSITVTIYLARSHSWLLNRVTHIPSPHQLISSSLVYKPPPSWRGLTMRLIPQKTTHLAPTYLTVHRPHVTLVSP